MHRSYSLREQRAPTASQVANGGQYQQSSSRSNNRIFGSHSLSQAFRRSSAGAFGPEMARKLSQLIKMEKSVMRSTESAARSRKDVAKQLSMWGERCDADVSDISDKIGVLLYEISELQESSVDQYDHYRVTLKAIRNIESSVQPSRERKEKLLNQIHQLKYKDPDSPQIVTLEQELVRAEAESLVAEAQLSNGTRSHFKHALTILFDSFTEYAEKLAVLSGYGHHLLDLVDDMPITPGECRPPYDSYETSKQIITDAERDIRDWLPEDKHGRDEAIPAPETFEQNNLDDAYGQSSHLRHQGHQGHHGRHGRHNAGCEERVVTQMSGDNVQSRPPQIVDDGECHGRYNEVTMNETTIVT